ncbi:MAG: hypothetical protein PVJ27_12265 [Candidatus Brocadiaceae bacterium]
MPETYDPAEPARPTPAPPADEHRGIPRARKVRLLVLVAVLAGLVAAAAALTAYTTGKRRERKERAADALRQVRQALGELDLPAAADALERAAQLAPESPEPPRLAVTVFYASGALDQAFGQFNRLELGGVGEIHDAGAAYVRRCSLLWNVARRLTRGGTDDRHRALLLCRWFALYVLPQQRSDLPAEPYVVLWRGGGTPEEMAWAYAELARQARLHCRVVIFPALPGEQPLVQVYPEGEEPFLVDPYRGIPVVDPPSKKLMSAADIASDFHRYRELRAMAGEPPASEGDNPGEPALKIAVHPQAFDPRFRAFEVLLADLPVYPLLSADPQEAPPSAPEGLWTAPARIVRKPLTDQAADRSAQVLQLTGPGRNEYLLGRNNRADALYRQTIADLEAKLAEADVEESAQILGEALENVSFYAAANAHEAGDLDGATERIRDYLTRYPTGRWRTCAQVLLADALERSGDGAGTAPWDEVPRGRKLYAFLRAEGLLPPPGHSSPEAAEAASEARYR